MSESVVASIPRHVAVIMDGNGRWAEARGLPRIAGHRAGTNNIRHVVRLLGEHGIEYVTLFAFSTENWDRPTSEVQGLLRTMARVIDRETKDFHRHGVRLRLLGRIDKLSLAIQRKVEYAISLTKDNSRLTLSIAFDYGGRAEIVEAVRRIIQDGIPPQDISESLFSRYLYTADIPDPDLIIRTGGEMRLSNFLLWQSAYSEYYATPCFWPDFGKEEVDKALVAYSRRERRFGRLETAGEAKPRRQG